MGLVGAEWRTFIDDHWFVRGHTEAAAQGSSAGYMQVMGGAGRTFRVSKNTELLAAVSVGGGGGRSRRRGNTRRSSFAAADWFAPISKSLRRLAE
jgi:hypothetical protein